MASDEKKKKKTTIESLPDCLLCHILSFLSTRDAAATGFLSKRWKPLWHSLHSLEFNRKDYPDFRKFRNFINSVLFSRNSIQSLRLICGFYHTFNLDDFNLFLYAASLKGIQQLDLRLDSSNFIPLPNCFYSCKTLVTLKLHDTTLNCSSCSVDFPLLKSLYLDAVILQSSTHFKFFRGCPNLEDIYARSVTTCNILLPVEEAAEFLPKLVTADISFSCILFPMLCNARFFCARMNFNGRVYNPTFHNLTHMDLTFEFKHLTFEFKRCNVMWNWFAEVLHNVPKLQNLTIHKDHVCVNDGQWNDPQIVPECLSSQLRSFTLKYYKGSKSEVQFAKYIMQNSKVLENMTIHTTLDIDLKQPMLETFSLCPRGSAACNLRFDTKPAQRLRSPNAL